MIAAWLRERFRPAVFLPIAVVIAAASSLSVFSPGVLLQDSVLTLFLLLQFRLWDDLADRSADAVTHPHRVLVQTRSTQPFVTLNIALALLNIGLSVRGSESALAVSTLLTLNAALGLMYALRTHRSIGVDQLLLAKYPAFVLIVAGDRAIAAPLTTTIAAAAIYAGASIYEAWHDPMSPVGHVVGGRQ